MTRATAGPRKDAKSGRWYFVADPRARPRRQEAPSPGDEASARRGRRRKSSIAYG